MPGGGAEILWQMLGGGTLKKYHIPSNCRMRKVPSVFLFRHDQSRLSNVFSMNINKAVVYTKSRKWDCFLNPIEILVSYNKIRAASDANGNIELRREEGKKGQLLLTIG